ncbi:unnamed protein product [Rangifer tarandus platyrhynchus]|uniref:Uncharacterized protein n=2 Tax=Rangifer tarandus platyrhynchus TaxID=3082113 RepID=A0ACB0DSR3_RANTA|nr:unnamed protein product [Rangifer tarandus platyrhynchus]CAI9691291.1 unnamed protein product [Rangifer tarandus platyrhynchus]
MSALHISRVRALYPCILLLHRVLPPDLKDLGDHLFEAKMSGSQLEQAVTALIELFHKYSGRSDTIEKEALLQLLKENFPNFLSACIQRGTAVAAELVEEAHRLQGLALPLGSRDREPGGPGTRGCGGGGSPDADRRSA